MTTQTKKTQTGCESKKRAKLILRSLGRLDGCNNQAQDDRASRFRGIKTHQIRGMTEGLGAARV